MIQALALSQFVWCVMIVGLILLAMIREEKKRHTYLVIVNKSGRAVIKQNCGLSFVQIYYLLRGNQLRSFTSLLEAEKYKERVGNNLRYSGAPESR